MDFHYAIQRRDSKTFTQDDRTVLAHVATQLHSYDVVGRQLIGNRILYLSVTEPLGKLDRKRLERQGLCTARRDRTYITVIPSGQDV